MKENLLTNFSCFDAKWIPESVKAISSEPELLELLGTACVVESKFGKFLRCDNDIWFDIMLHSDLNNVPVLSFVDLKRLAIFTQKV